MSLYKRLYEWFEANKRILPWRETDDAYRIWLSEIILQQTRVVQGIDYYQRFVQRWPRVEDLASADESDVLREWQGLGYYSRARHLHQAAQMIVSEGWCPFPMRYEDIRSLPGVGDYTAGAIASFAYDQAYPAMDGNVYRVVSRLLDIDEPFDTSAGKKLFRQEIERLLDRAHPRLFNSAIMEFGALYCTPTNVRRNDAGGRKEEGSGSLLESKCPYCPLSVFCSGYSHGTAELLPVRKARPKVRERWFDYHIYISERTDRYADRVQNTDLYTLIRRREDPKDIWYHLYEFPCEESEGGQNTEYRAQNTEYRGQNTEDRGQRTEYRGQSTDSSVVCELSHTLSHQRIHARFIIHKVSELPQMEGTIAVRWEELDDYALSRLTLRAIDILESFLPR